MELAVLGVQRIGLEIAEAFAVGGNTVVVIDEDGDAAQEALAAWRAGLERRAARGKLEPERAAELVAAVRAGHALQDAAGAMVVIDDRSEDDALVQEGFRTLAQVCDEGAIFTVDSPNVNITAAGDACGRPGQVAGFHFASPANVMTYVEVIPGKKTSEETLQMLCDLAADAGKRPHVVKDRPGAVMLSLIFPLMNNAIRLLEEGAGAREAIDASLIEGAGHPMGPLQIADLIGLDVLLEATEALYQRSGDSQFEPPAMLRQLVESGKLGRKTKEGFYSYER